MHFDCVQAHSGQMLMPATHFALGAAAAGLLPTSQTLTYPKDSEYTRIVLQRFTPAGVKIRLAKGEPRLTAECPLALCGVALRCDALRCVC